MNAPQKGKQGTKGAKQIVKENLETLTFYRNLALGANVITLLILIFYHSTLSIVLFLFAGLIHTAAFQFMAYMAKVKNSETGQLLDPGVDLNMEGGVAEHVKDIIILTAACQVLSGISNYFWLLWLLAPIRGGWIVWKNILQPYFFQSGPAEPEVNEKKQKKMERKMKRMQR